MSAPIVLVTAPAAPPLVIVTPQSAPVVFVSPQGPPGLPGGAPSPLTYALASVSSWYQVHSFPYPPEATVVENNDAEVAVTVTYPDANHVHISFPAPFTGTVVLR